MLDLRCEICDTAQNILTTSKEKMHGFRWHCKRGIPISQFIKLRFAYTMFLFNASFDFIIIHLAMNELPLQLLMEVCEFESCKLDVNVCVSMMEKDILVLS